MCLLHDLDTYGGVDPLGVFPLFLKKVADIIAPKLSIIRLRSFPECWRSVNVTAVRKGVPSPDKENYRPISIISILSKQSVSEYHVRSTVFLKHRPNWDDIRCAARRFKWGTI